MSATSRCSLEKAISSERDEILLLLRACSSSDESCASTICLRMRRLCASRYSASPTSSSCARVRGGGAAAAALSPAWLLPGWAASGLPRLGRKVHSGSDVSAGLSDWP